ncbi:class I adenylate-forming enzyme family protein [Deferrisoma camini]|uniref:class I adenylate-forming enzyme family protein n=1 Tax=Deferrisoma camini TaxID=1035120 RepID=UPI00046CBAC8|nr:long-chain-fatty-acid--CoA ligase [Deferrisoma camini]
MTLAELVDRNSRQSARKEALRARGESHTYQELRRRAEAVAARFQAWGISPGDRVAIMSQNTPDFVFALLGALKAGAVVVPVNHKLMAGEVAYILEHSEAKVFLFDGTLAPVARQVPATVGKAALDSAAEGFDRFDTGADGAEAYHPVRVSDEDLAEILYTSGTTGRPKGCMLTHRSVVMAAVTGALAVHLDEDDRMLMAMPIWHSSPLNNWFFGTAYVGGTTVLLREYHPLHFLETIQQERCTVYFGAPISYLMPLQTVPDFDRYDLSSMRAWIYGGGPIAPETVRELTTRYRSDRFYQVYGMTETGPTGTVLRPKDHRDKAGSIGCRGLPGADLRLMKTETEEAGPGETGEIWLKADSVMAGYLKDPEATRAAFRDGWYRTGDVARMDADGYLYVVDRLKDMIVTGGENVYSKEVEDAIAEHDKVREAAVIGVPHPAWGETVVAYVVPVAGETLEAEDLAAFLAPRLARYKIPRVFRFVEELPHTPSGKVMKYKLRQEHSA